MGYLEKINSPQDLKMLSPTELPPLCEELRQFLLDTVSRSGGHLASNLGVVELTVALHYVFDSPKDRLCWDVGHQTYVHKILTGRKDRLHTVRTLGGISGFPKISESEHDLYETGHAGTAVSQAFAEAVARDLKLKNGEIKENYAVVAIVGDASIVTGMAFEAMNHAGYLKTPFLIVLNDNEMSISPNVGAISYSLSRLITHKMYNRVSRRWFLWLSRLAGMGKILNRFLHRLGASMKGLVTDHQFFEELGFRYLGPIDGHDVVRLVNIFEKLRYVEEPTVLHVVTRKGKGYEKAEQDPVKYHGVSPFEPEKGLAPTEKVSLSKIVGRTLTLLGKQDPTILAITPAMKEGSGLNEFAENFPERFFDTGIAEQHATTFAGALAKAKLKPFLCIYSTFLQRGYDQLIHDICLMNLPVRLVIDRAGCVGGDGETHQGLYDIAYMSAIPHITLLSVSDGEDLACALNFMASFEEGPISVRFPRKDIAASVLQQIQENSFFTKPWDPYLPEVLVEGEHGLLFVEGAIKDNALRAAEILRQEGFSLQVVLIRCLRPLNIESLLKLSQDKPYIFTLENHVQSGGMGEKIALLILKHYPEKKVRIFAYPEKPIEHGSIPAIEKKYGLDPQSLASIIGAELKKLGRQKESKIKFALR
ncbi:MAG: 1-deoxy-D-xylulose-5-phosphate synthase [Leptospiraceae bacterium]|nr:1-deoxy-D-xylulose-5-phosphate synthase [Leptospiraceae bacterium]MDW8307489.1 1-deoxy-D-xylulose-5-phosphate synthase [Leptospiraceae bacterium]